MNTHELVSEIAQRLPYLRRADVQEVMDVLIERLQVELAKPQGQVRLTGVGKLYVETHALKASGIIREQIVARDGVAPMVLVRHVYRFTPSQGLLEALKKERAHDA
jgi:nucleoid DNA-binding protein